MGRHCYCSPRIVHRDKVSRKMSREIKEKGMTLSDVHHKEYDERARTICGIGTMCDGRRVLFDGEEIVWGRIIGGTARGGLGFDKSIWRREEIDRVYNKVRGKTCKRHFLAYGVKISQKARERDRELLSILYEEEE